MGLFDNFSLFGRKETGTSSGSTTTTAETTSKTQQQAETGTAGAQVQETKQTTLSPEVQAALQNVITGANLAGTGRAQADIASLLAGRAATAEQDVNQAISGILGEARRAGEQDLASRSSKLAERTGSTANTLQQLIGSEARAGLESQLGGLAGELNLQGRQAVTEELSGVLAALGQQATQAAGVGSVLKGAEITGRTEQQSVDVQQRLVQQLIEELKQGQTMQTQSGTSSKGGNLLDVLNTISAFTDM